VKILVVVGARPQFIKAAPISRAVERWNREHLDRRIDEIVVHTGQHYDYEMSTVFFEELALAEPRYHLGVGSGTHAYQTGEMLKGIEVILVKEKPDIVVVYGDTNSTLAGAMAAAKLSVPVAHVEAGLRSFNRKMPEEINRVLTDHLSTWLFCPTEPALKNLEREGITRGVYQVADVMYESLIHYSERAEKMSMILDQHRLATKQYAVMTVHRAENTESTEQLERIMAAVMWLADHGWRLIFPVHPRTRKLVDSLRPAHENLLLINPVSYLDMLKLERNARLILTDSGGIQKEAYWFRVPCVTLREETEWVETVERGWNRLVGANTDRIIKGSLEAVEARPTELAGGEEMTLTEGSAVIVAVLADSAR